jgi:DNA polymerase III delta prime subunit
LVNVDDVQDPQWNDHPYDNLVLNEEQKTLLMAFADNQNRNTGFDDFVKHKGKMCPIRGKQPDANNANPGEGTIILLAGPPGVGKTLTSEAGECDILS